MAARLLIGLAALAAALIRQLARDDKADKTVDGSRPRRRSAVPRKIGYRPGSIGDVSSQIGCDVRDLIVAGYSNRQIYQVVDGKITLQQLLRSEPENKRR